MKRILLAFTLCFFCTIALAGCTNVPTSVDEKENASPTSEPETTLVPVKQIDPSLNASSSQLIDEALTEIDTMAKDLQPEKFSDLPNALGQ